MITLTEHNRIPMLKNLPFNKNVALYEEWFEKHPYVFQSELAAIKKVWPAGEGLVSLEIGAATGRFAKALGITEAVEPTPNMAVVAEARGVNVLREVAEDLPYKDGQMDVVLINFCICYLDLPRAFSEAFRVLKNDGQLVLGFLDRNSTIGSYYEHRKPTSRFYKHAKFYTVEEVEACLKETGFTGMEYSQTLFNDLEKTNTVEESIPGFGKGSYVIVKAVKKAV